MTTTPQAALLSDDEINSIWSGGPPGSVLTPWGIAKIRAIEQAIIAKLQATQEPVQAGELPGYSRLIKAASELIMREFLPSYIVDDYPHKTMSRSKVAKMMEQPHDKLRLLGIEVSEGAKQMRSALSARKPAVPLTDEQFPKVVWPKARDVGRIGDMGKGAHVRVGLDSDNDVYVSAWDECGGASVEFCNPGGGGGGQSGRTRMALIALMVAMEADNAEKPSRDWWAVRNGIGLEVKHG